MSLHFSLPSFSCGGEGSPPFGAPAVREGESLHKESGEWHGSRVFLAVSQPSPAGWQGDLDSSHGAIRPCICCCCCLALASCFSCLLLSGGRGYGFGGEGFLPTSLRDCNIHLRVAAEWNPSPYPLPPVTSALCHKGRAVRGTNSREAGIHSGWSSIKPSALLN